MTDFGGRYNIAIMSQVPEDKNNQEEVYRFRLKKQELRSEREERKDRFRRRLTRVIALIVAISVAFALGLLLGAYKLNMQPSVSFDTDKIEEIAYYIENYWLYGDDYEDLIETLYDQALYGMTELTDDPYSTYASAEEAEDFSNSINVSFVGIGVGIRQYAGGILITKIYEDSPALKAGLEAGDIIMAVDGQSVYGMSVSDVKEIIVGEVDTSVNLTILRDGEYMEVEVTRGSVDTSVSGRVIDDVVILEIASFGLDTYDECVDFLSQYTDYDKLIIDLRDNTGGYSSAVEKIAGLFLPEGSVLMREVDKYGNETAVYVNSDIYYDNFEQIIILTNSSTASASEVLTLALIEARDDVYTVGTTTYGKGVIQTTFSLSDGSYLRLTIYEWTSDAGTSINGVGIVPDYEVYLNDIYYQSVGSFPDTVYEVDDVSTYIAIVQECLDLLGYDVERTDGYFDESLEVAITIYAQEHSIDSDGTLTSEVYSAITSSAMSYLLSDEGDAQLVKALELLADEG